MRCWALLFLLALGCSDNSGAVGGALPYVPWADVPATVKSAARSQRPDVQFRSAFRLPNGGYQIRARDKRGKGVGVDVTADGTVLQMFTY